MFNTENTKFILASASPRRAEILRMLGLSFEICATNIDESVLPNEIPKDYVVRLAETKSKSVPNNNSNADFIIGADTIVILDEKILGKPLDKNEAVLMLHSLSGRRHEVITGVSLYRCSDRKIFSGYECTRVWFGFLSEQWIKKYVDSKEPLDKAGAYGIQGPASIFIDRIEGNYLNIVGLPMNLVRQLIQKVELGK